MHTPALAGSVAYTVSFKDTTGNVAEDVSASTDGSDVLLDLTAPSWEGVKMLGTGKHLGWQTLNSQLQ